MDDNNYGGTIAGFAAGAYRTMFGVTIDPHQHPMTSWAQSTVSREQHNFEETKKETVRLLEGVQHTLYQKQSDEHLGELAELQERLEATTSITALGQEIRDSSDLLDKAFAPPAAQSDAD